MKLRCFAVHDAKVEAYLNPFFMRTAGEALRGFADAANSDATDIGKHPEDFTLFEIGEFDGENGTFVPLLTPHPLGKALSYRKVGIPSIVKEA